VTDREQRRGGKLGVGERRSVVAGIGVLAWIVGLLWIFPVVWTVFTSFKTEEDASCADAPPRPQLRPLQRCQSRDGRHPLAADGVHELVRRGRRIDAVRPRAGDTGCLRARDPPDPQVARRPFFFISTKFLPIVASIFPDLRVRAEGGTCLGTRNVLIILYIAINLPARDLDARSFFMEVPRELIEAAEIDGTKPLQPAALGDSSDRGAGHRGDRALVP
jgi:sorbitol/mannitol transport system permease protein